MQSGNKDDIEKPDMFSLEVGKKLREHRMAVDPEIWEAWRANFLLAQRFLIGDGRLPVWQFCYWGCSSF